MNQTAIMDASVGNVMNEVRKTALLTSLCTFSQPDGNYSSTGAPTGTYLACDGLTNIPCTAPVISPARIQATEVKDFEQILSMNIRHVLLDGYYGDVPVVQPNGDTVFGPQSFMRATIGGFDFDVLGVEHDSQHQMTRVSTRVAALGAVGGA